MKKCKIATTKVGSIEDWQKYFLGDHKTKRGFSKAYQNDLRRIKKINPKNVIV